MHKAVLAIGAGAMLLGSAPAAARDKDERRSDRRHHRDRDKGDEAVGGFVLGALAVGLVAALSKKPRPTPEVVAEAPEFVAETVETDADAAVSACAAAVEGEGRRTFALAQAGQVRGVVPAGEGFAVDGDVLLRGRWQEPGERRGFRCTVDAQAVRTVEIDGLRMLAAAEPVPLSPRP